MIDRSIDQEEEEEEEAQKIRGGQTLSNFEETLTTGIVQRGKRKFGVCERLIVPTLGLL